MLTWSNSYETGVTSVDRDHRRLFWCLNEWERAIQQRRGPAAMARLLAQFEQYAKAHVFGLEVRAQEEGGDSEAISSVEAARALLEKITRARQRLATSGGAGPLVSELHAELCDCTSRHLLSLAGDPAPLS
jgi:hypothetical protein